MPKLEEEDVLEEDRGDSFDPDEIIDLDDDDDGEEFESSVEDEEEEEEEDSEEEESEEEEEEDSEEEDEEEDIKEEEEPRIPKGRLNQVIKQRDQERARAAKLAEQNEALIRKLTMIEDDDYEEEEEEQNIEPAYDFKAKYREARELFLEGEIDKSIELEMEIASKKDALLKAELKSYRDEARVIAKQVQEDEKYDTLVSSYETKYSFLDNKTDDYNEEAVDTVNALARNFVMNGDSKLVALRKAVDRIAPMYSKERPTTTTKSRTSPNSKTVQRNITASKSQPPKQVGKKVATRDIGSLRASHLSEREFAKLTDREKRILRGD